MRDFPVICWVILTMVSLVGCRTAQPRAEIPTGDTGASVMKPVELLTGKIVRVNPAGRFVVIAFPPANLPPVDREFEVYRAGAKVGELRVTPPQREDMTVADILAGDVQAGDQVRSR